MADQRLPDEEILLRQKARQRLIGAVTLMMAAVVVLPWALDGKPRMRTHEIAVYLPASGAPVNDAPPALVPAVTPTAPVADVPAPAAAVPPPAPVARAETMPKEDTAAPAAAVKPAPTPAPPVAPQTLVARGADAVSVRTAHGAATPKAAVTQTPVAKPSRADREDAPVAARQRPVVTPAEDTPPAGAAAEPPHAMQGFVLQLGTFAQADNARQLKARLAAKGVPAFTEHLATPAGDRVRVRVGPYASREAAEKALGQVNGLGLSGVVLNAH